MASRYDLRMEEIARQREAEQAGLDRIEDSTATINRGMADPINWALGIASIVLIPFTGGLSVGLALIALLRMTAGGRANVQAIQPTTADLAAPGYGCIRILGALGVLVIMALVALLFGLILWANVTGVQMK